jgi:hypothetical protein
MEDFVKINVKPETREKLNKLSKLHQRRMYIFLEQAVDFFDRTGFDPLQSDVESPAAEMKKLRNSLVSFIRKQEKDLLVPMMDRVDEMVKTMAVVMKDSSPLQAKNNIQQTSTIPKSNSGGLKIPKGAVSQDSRM